MFIYLLWLELGPSSNWNVWQSTFFPHSAKLCSILLKKIKAEFKILVPWGTKNEMHSPKYLWEEKKRGGGKGKFIWSKTSLINDKYPSFSSIPAWPLCIPELCLPVASHEVFDLSWGNDFYTSQKLGRCWSPVPEKGGFQNKVFKLEDRFNDSYVLFLLSPVPNTHQF